MNKNVNSILHQKTYSLLFIALLSFLFISCSNAPKKSELQLEAEKQAQNWWDNSIAKCNDTFVTKYKGISIGVGRDINDIQEGYFQFKNISYGVQELPLTEADKLNGIEWQGVFAIQPFEPALRYYETGNRTGYYSPAKWSDWGQELIIYREGHNTQQNRIIVTPVTRVIKKVKGKWEGFSTEFSKPQCSEIPNG